MRQTTMTAVFFSFVLAGLGPAIHVFVSHRSSRREHVDARNRSGHDASQYVATESDQGRGRR